MLWFHDRSLRAHFVGTGKVVPFRPGAECCPDFRRKTPLSFGNAIPTVLVSSPLKMPIGRNSSIGQRPFIGISPRLRAGEIPMKGRCPIEEFLPIGIFNGISPRLRAGVTYSQLERLRDSPHPRDLRQSYSGLKQL